MIGPPVRYAGAPFEGKDNLFLFFVTDAANPL